MKLSISKQTTLKSFKVIAVNVVILAVLLELASLATYFVQTGEFFYARKEKVPAAARNLAGNRLNEVGSNKGIIQQLHPYFGFVNKYDLDFELKASQIVHRPNNYGFYSPYDYPFKKQNESQFVIGIFGGSVAMHLSTFELESHILATSLRQLPYFRNKEIIVLSFAAGSYKQPQQLLVLNYFLSIGQNFDMVVNVDGFNDAALSYLNNQHGIDLSMPNQLVIMPLVRLANKGLSPEELSLTLQVLQNKSRVNNALARLENCWLATCYALNWLQLKYVARQYNKELLTLSQVQESTRPNENSIVKIDGPAHPLDDSVALQKIGALWAESSVLMKKALDEQQVLYFHFLQTNQYQDTGRKFSAEEQKIAFGGPSPYAEAARKGYPVLLSKSDFLKGSGVHFFSGAKVFDNIGETVYDDNCCHYNEIGNTAVLNFVSKSISEVVIHDPKFLSSRQ